MRNLLIVFGLVGAVGFLTAQKAQPLAMTKWEYATFSEVQHPSGKREYAWLSMGLAAVDTTWAGFAHRFGLTPGLAGQFAVLQQAGGNGWELIQCEIGRGGGFIDTRCVFKRPKV